MCALEDDIRPENRYYLYHHYKDNCVTRLRDHIDVASDYLIPRLQKNERAAIECRLAQTGHLVTLVPVAAGNLANAIQDAAAAPYAGGAVLLGGLTPADISSDEIVTATRAGSQRVGRIPTALHDSAAVKIGARTYLFGGGTGVSEIDTILMVDPRTGAAQAIGHLPAGSSDQSAAAIGQTAYIVGGYTGTRWLDTIVAWSPSGKARVVAHLPHTLRYAAVTAAAGRIVIAGGSLENGTATDSEKSNTSVRPAMRPKPVTMFLAKVSEISKKSPSSTTFRINSFMS